MTATGAADRRRRGGFTLIEVLIAAAIMGFGLTALLTAASRCLAVMRAAKQYQDAQWALNLGELEHPILPNQEPEDWAVSSERLENGMTYEREVEEPPKDRQDGLYVLRSRVIWSEKGRNGREEITRYVFMKDKAEL